jgi:poly(beta-D-mannuronate) lyase
MAGADVKGTVVDLGSTMVRVSAARGAGRQLIVAQGPSGFVRLCQTPEFLKKHWRTATMPHGKPINSHRFISIPSFFGFFLFAAKPQRDFAAGDPVPRAGHRRCGRLNVLEHLAGNFWAGRRLNGFIMKRILTFGFVFGVSTLLMAAEVKVSSLAELQAAVDGAVPGARIVVANGVYAATNAIRVTCRGTAKQPVVIAAETQGGVELGGAKGFAVAEPAAYVVIQGFKFTHGMGIEASGGGEWVGPGASHCRFTRNVFEMPGSGRGYYLMISGDDTEVDHNSFQNKFSVGQMIIVHGPGTDAMAQRVWIHQNIFTNFPDTKQNNCSAIQIGVSGRSLSPAHALVESNLFVRCRGENENICNKSCDNVYRYNTFAENCSELSLRHGDRNVVYGNFFLGTDGLRMFGKNDRIFSNYFQDCSRGIHIGNGDGVVPKDKLTSHDRPDGMEIVYNTLVDCKEGVVMLRRQNGLGATNITFADNLITGPGRLVAINGPVTHAVWRGNILWGDTNGISGEMAKGFAVVDPQLKADAQGEFHLAAGSPAIGKGDGVFAYVTVDVDGRARGRKYDVGAEQFAASPVAGRILKPADVGPWAR